MQVFPLTDDYDFILDHLDRAEGLRGDHDGFSAGSTSAASGASLIGDGLASCVPASTAPTTSGPAR